MTVSALGVEIIGHRGASEESPENTLASVQLAWQQNADAVEVDVMLSRDGQIVVFHDKETDRIGGVKKLVSEQTLEELQKLDVGSWKGKPWEGESIPTLSQVLATIPDGKQLFIEIKAEMEIIPELKRVLKTAKTKPSQTVVIGFSLPTLKAIKAEIPAIPVLGVVALKKRPFTRRWSPSAKVLIENVKRSGLDGVDIGLSPGIDRKFVAQVKQAGLQFYVWTVNSKKDALRLRDFGVDGIATDRPGGMRERLWGGGV